MATLDEMANLWVLTAVIAAVVVVFCLKILAAEMENAMRRHNLQAEVRTLRQKQSERLRALGLKSKR